MKKTYKLIALTAVFLILFVNMFVFSASAAGVKYSASSASGYTGDSVTISVKASPSNVWGCVVSLGYNSSELQCLSCAKGGIATSGSVNNNGSRVTFAGQIAGSGGGTIFTATFRILKKSGTCKLTVSASGGGDNCDSDGNPVSYSTSGATVTVKEKATSTTSPATTKTETTTKNETTTKQESTTQGIAVASITLNKTSVTLNKNETASLSATVLPSNATNKTVSYRSSNKNVVTVNSSGTITAVGGGTATITATAGGKSTTCKVSVISKQTGITHQGSSTKSLAVGKTLNLKVEKVPSDATDTYITTWKSSDTSVATVSDGGVVKGVKEGSVTITAESNGWQVRYTLNVTAETEEDTDEETTETTVPATADNTTEQESITEDITVNGEGNIFSRIFNIIPENGNTNSKSVIVFAILISLVIALSVALIVTILVAVNIKKNKDKSKDPSGPEDK
ncbi:MAG: Ig-like domain-containing protein [Clostridiales bacterium]|nr:Ig-like domain-containing protein [Clostridiales bacterium]